MSELPKETPINPGLSSVTSREQGGSSVTEQTMPHSGGKNVPEELREQPVREFPNTSLEEAVSQGYLEVPTSPSIIPEAQPAPEKEGWSLKTKLIAIGATVLTAAGAMTAAIGISNAANSNEKGPQEGINPDPKTPVEVVPKTPVEVEKSFEQQVDELKIKSGLSAEEYANTLIAGRLIEWQFAGKEQYWEAMNDIDNSIDDKNAALDTIVDEQNRIYANALLIPGWQNTSLANLAERRKTNQAATLDTWGRTKVAIEISGDSREEWKEGMVIESVKILEENPEAGTRKLFIAGYQTNNGDKAAYKSVNAKNNGAPWSFTVTTQTIDGVEYVSDWSNTESPTE